MSDPLMGLTGEQWMERAFAFLSAMHRAKAEFHEAEAGRLIAEAEVRALTAKVAALEQMTSTGAVHVPAGPRLVESAS